MKPVEQIAQELWNAVIHDQRDDIGACNPYGEFVPAVSRLLAEREAETWEEAARIADSYHFGRVGAALRERGRKHNETL